MLGARAKPCTKLASVMFVCGDSAAGLGVSTVDKAESGRLTGGGDFGGVTRVLISTVQSGKSVEDSTGSGFAT